MSLSHQAGSSPADPLGWSTRSATLFSSYSSNCQPARIVRVDKGLATAALSVHEHIRVPAYVKREMLAVGDWVAVAHDDRSAVAAALPRWSALLRRSADRSTTAQVLAANIDVVAITHDLSKPFNIRRAERELVMAWDAGARPIIVLTKSDLCRIDIDDALNEVANSLNGVDVLVVSATTGNGVDDLADVFAGRTGVFLGASGAGKSSLVNALAHVDLQDTGEVRAGDGRGRHTTTAGELICLGDGTVVIDTPGIRTVGLWESDGDGLEAVFSDIAELAVSCRFADCQHDAEPGCAVRDVIDGGRLSSYRKLQREIERVSDERAGWEKAQANQARRRWSKQVSRSQRNRP
jgi:ribosome biogenesis GTPase / thiamine phosphate phosphatase